MSETVVQVLVMQIVEELLLLFRDGDHGRKESMSLSKRMSGLGKSVIDSGLGCHVNESGCARRWIVDETRTRRSQ